MDENGKKESEKTMNKKEVKDMTFISCVFVSFLQIQITILLTCWISPSSHPRTPASFERTKVPEPTSQRSRAQATTSSSQVLYQSNLYCMISYTELYHLFFLYSCSSFLPFPILFNQPQSHKNKRLSICQLFRAPNYHSNSCWRFADCQCHFIGSQEPV